MNKMFVASLLVVVCGLASGCASLPSRLANSMDELAPPPPDETFIETQIRAADSRRAASDWHAPPAEIQLTGMLPPTTQTAEISGVGPAEQGLLAAVARTPGARRWVLTGGARCFAAELNAQMAAGASTAPGLTQAISRRCGSNMTGVRTYRWTSDTPMTAASIEQHIAAVLPGYVADFGTEHVATAAHHQTIGSRSYLTLVASIRYVDLQPVALVQPTATSISLSFETLAYGDSPVVGAVATAGALGAVACTNLTQTGTRVQVTCPFATSDDRVTIEVSQNHPDASYSNRIIGVQVFRDATSRSRLVYQLTNSDDLFGDVATSPTMLLGAINDMRASLGLPVMRMVPAEQNRDVIRISSALTGTAEADWRTIERLSHAIWAGRRIGTRVIGGESVTMAFGALPDAGATLSQLLETPYAREALLDPAHNYLAIATHQDASIRQPMYAMVAYGDDTAVNNDELNALILRRINRERDARGLPRVRQHSPAIRESAATSAAQVRSGTRDLSVAATNLVNRVAQATGRALIYYTFYTKSPYTMWLPDAVLTQADIRVTTLGTVVQVPGQNRALYGVVIVYQDVDP